VYQYSREMLIALIPKSSMFLSSYSLLLSRAVVYIPD
jgi:hypothetical protein